ncbi:MAG: alpha/beta hydrolase [Cyclobacteriaceae bacterium]|nr:alpha/beta hydrolase [Cyclobacteriaceae bacterium]
MKTLGCVLLLLVMVTCQQQSPVSEIPASEKPKVISDGVEIAYDLCGSGETTVVLIHGWCIDRSYWSHQVAALCDEYKVVALDLAGHGESGQNRDLWTVEQFGKDVSELINQLKLEQVVLVGHSMGGDVMLETALLQKDKVGGIIGIDTFKDTGHVPDSSEQAAIEGFMQFIRSDFKGAADVFADQVLFSPQTDSISRQRVLHSIKSADTLRAVAVLESLLNYASKEIPQLKILSKKLYLINSDVTPTMESYFNQAGIEFEVIDIAGTGHYPMIEKPVEFTEVLLKTLGLIVQDI